MNASQIPPSVAEPDLRSEITWWLKRLLACNPFYLVSAACLLYGLYQLTLDPAFRHGEVGQLTSIFGSLQLYEILVVGTAIFLARRLIWYDSTLLVTMENMFVFVPFILVTLAMYIGDEAAWGVCGTGAALAAARFASLKRLIPVLNLPHWSLVLGAVILAVNLSVPFCFRAVHETDATPLPRFSQIGWLFVLPALLSFANALPRPSKWGDVAAQRSWLPVFFAAIWITVSAVHLYCIGYVYDLKWQFGMLAPLLWVAGWTAYNRVGDLTPYPSVWLLKALLILPAAMLFFGSTQIVFVLAVLNVAIYAWIFLQERDNRFAFHLGLISLAIVFAAMPATHAFPRERCIQAAIIGYVILRALLTANPLMALAGAAGVTLAVDHFFHTPVALQAGFAFALLHSIFWQSERHIFADAIRSLVALAWVWHSWSWMHNAGALAGWSTASFAVVILTGYLLVRIIWYYWASRVIPAAATLVMLWMPVKTAFATARAIPIGFVPVLIAFALFGLGTLIALRRDKWLRLQ